MLDRDGRPRGWFTDRDAELYVAAARQLPLNGVLVEVGTYLGRSTSYVAEIVHQQGARLVCIDHWRGSSNDCTASMQTNGPEMLAAFHDNMRHLGLSKFMEVRVLDSLSAAAEFKDESIDVVFLDADHSYGQVRQDIRIWWPKLKTDGLLLGHDYYRFYSGNHTDGVKMAVEETFGLPDAVSGSVWQVRKSAVRHVRISSR